MIESSEVDFGNAVAVFQCADDVVFIRNVDTERCMDTKRERWEEIQRRLHVCFGFAPEAQVEIDGECEDETSPSSAYVYKLVPWPYTPTVGNYKALRTGNVSTIGVEYT
jgi:hypothetical protein